jgi:hypothetical protein
MAARASAISRETLETLKGMKTILGDNLSVAADLKIVLDQMYNPIEKSEKVLKDWGDSLHHVADFVSDGIDKFKQLNALTMRIHRLDAEDVKNKEKSIKLLRDLKAEYTDLKTLHTGDLKKLQDIDKVLNSIGEAEGAVATGAADISDKLKAAAENARGVNEAFDDMDYSKPIASAHKLGKSLDDGISGALRGLKLLDNFGFKGLFGNLANMQMKIKQIKEETIKSGQARAGQYNRAAGSAYKEFTSGDVMRREEGFSQLGGLYKNAETPEARAGLVRQLSGKTGVTGMLDRALGKRALAAAGGGNLGFAGKMGMGLMESGGGSVLGGAAMQMAGPMAAIYGLVQLFSKGFERNKEIYSKLGGGGIVQRGNMGANYNKWSNALSAGGLGQGPGSARYFDLNFEKMTDLMKEVIESGQAVQNKYGMINGGMSPDQALTGGRATNVYSGIVRNAAMFGKNIGLDSGESAKLTMKLMHDFSLSMGEVEDMFIGIDKAVQVTGISTIAYLKLIDDVTSQFDKLNKSLNYTCGLMLLLGNNAKYTDDDIKGMVKGLTGNKKPYEQAIYGYQMAGPQGREELAKARQTQYRRTGAGLEKELGLGEGALEGMTREQIQNMVASGHPEQQALATRYLNDRNRGRSAMAKHGAFDLATQDELYGHDIRSDTTTQLSLLNSILPKGTHISDFIGGTKGAENRVQNLMSNKEFMGKANYLNISPEGISAKLGAAGQQIIGGISAAATTGGKEGEAARGKFTNISAGGWKEIRDALAEGKGISGTKAVQGALSGLGADQLGDVIVDAEEKAAAEKAKQNQSFITTPLDRINKSLDSIVENLITLLQKAVNFFNWNILGKDAYQAAKQNKEEAENYRQNQMPMDKTALGGVLKTVRGGMEKPYTAEKGKHLHDALGEIYLNSKELLGHLGHDTVSSDARKEANNALAFLFSPKRNFKDIGDVNDAKSRITNALKSVTDSEAAGEKANANMLSTSKEKTTETGATGADGTGMELLAAQRQQESGGTGDTRLLSGGYMKNVKDSWNDPKSNSYKGLHAQYKTVEEALADTPIGLAQTKPSTAKHIMGRAGLKFDKDMFMGTGKYAKGQGRDEEVKNSQLQVQQLGMTQLESDFKQEYGEAIKGVNIHALSLAAWDGGKGMVEKALGKAIKSGDVTQWNSPANLPSQEARKYVGETLARANQSITNNYNVDASALTNVASVSAGNSRETAPSRGGLLASNQKLSGF